MITLELTDNPGDFDRIVELQSLNRPSAVAADKWATEGFVFMEYTIPELQQIPGGYRHVVAKSDGVVIGYALVMLKKSRKAFPSLENMFRDVEAGAFDGKP